MKSIREQIFEGKTKQGYSGYKMKNVGSGAGKLIGGSIASVPGAIIGHYVGKDIPRHPEDPADETRRSHRVALIGDEAARAKRLAIASAIGAGIGAGVAALSSDGDSENFKSNVGGGAILGTLLGGGVGSAVGSWKAAKRLGYGNLGKVSSVIGGGPLTGLTVPKKIKVAGYDTVSGREEKSKK